MADKETIVNMEDVDGKRLRKNVTRVTVDYNASIGVALKNRVWQRDYRDRRALQPHVLYVPQLMPPSSYHDMTMNSVTTHCVKSVMSKERCPIFNVTWMGNGKRLITGSSSGEFTVWNGLTFNFETITQAHESAIRSMVWSHNDKWLVSGDNTGYLKYWEKNLNCVKVFKAHEASLRGISFSHSDNKFVTCSDDGTLGVWDFQQALKESVLRGHGADVRCVQWHPQKSLIVSGSKDSQQSIKLWDPRVKEALNTLYAHKAPVTDLKWNDNGNWLVSASRDNLIKMFDVRKLDEEILTFRGHTSEVTNVAWHPIHEGLLSSGAFDGSIKFWHVGSAREIGNIDSAHNQSVWSLAWHPVGHILCSGSNDHTTKFWTRNRPGDLMNDVYNCKNLPVPDASSSGIETNINSIDETCIPLLGEEDKVDESLLYSKPIFPAQQREPQSRNEAKSRPIPENFLRQWNQPMMPQYVPSEEPPSVSKQVSVETISGDYIPTTDNCHNYNDYSNQNYDYNEDYNRRDGYSDHSTSNDVDEPHNNHTHHNNVPSQNLASTSNQMPVEEICQDYPQHWDNSHYESNDYHSNHQNYDENEDYNRKDGYTRDYFSNNADGRYNNYDNRNNGNYNGRRYGNKNNNYREENYNNYDTSDRQQRRNSRNRNNHGGNHKTSRENKSQRFNTGAQHRVHPYRR